MGKARARDDRGAVLVETVLVLPILIVLIFGMVEFGRVFNAQLQVNHAAREAARSYGITGDFTGATNRANDATTLTIVVTNTGPACDPLAFSGDAVEITVNTDVAISVPFFGSPTFTLTGVGSMRCSG